MSSATSSRLSPLVLLAALVLLALTLLVASAAGAPDLSTGREAATLKEFKR